MQRRNTISAKEAKERVAKKRAERLAAMKQAEKKETEDVNLYRSAEEQSDSIDTELDQIKQKSIADGSFMKAPNGKRTNLNERQWLQVRTKAFKEWFGDWENDPKNASKVVNENGEPLPVWHITNEDFTKFETSKARQNADIPAFYFATNKEDWKDMGKRAMSVFLNLRNPVEKPDANMQGSTVKERLLEKGVDGTYVIEDGQVAEYAAFFPNQIKSAADNVGTFDNENEDIRFRINRQ